MCTVKDIQLELYIQLYGVTVIRFTVIGIYGYRGLQLRIGVYSYRGLQL